MRASTLPRSRDLSEAAERQMRLWALQMESQRRMHEESAGARQLPFIHPYIAISREAGVNAGEIATTIAAKLGWKVLDREFLDYMAEHFHWPRIALEYVDERTASWFHETFGKLLDERLVSQAEYVSRLGKIALLAAQHESVVFVGRGVQFILPPEVGFAVRLIAPRKQRVQRIMQRLHCSQQAAEAYIDDIDCGRSNFANRYFHRDIADPHLYDLVANVKHLTSDGAAELILVAYRLSLKHRTTA
jgi:cytidylate kinase